MASKRYAFSSLIDHGLDPDLFIGFHFHPTYEEGIRIVNIKNTGGELPPIFNEYPGLFQCQPEQLEECYCFTNLELDGTKKVNRTLGDGSHRYWKNIKSELVRYDNNNKIGRVTKLKLHEDKNTTTEWHILEYRDTEKPDPGRWVLCQIYKREKNNDSGAGQIYSSTSQVSSMWASGARGDHMNQGQHYDIGQWPYIQPDWFPNAATNPYLNGGHTNQDQIHGVDPSRYTPQERFLSSPNSIDDFYESLLDDEFIFNQDCQSFNIN